MSVYTNTKEAHERLKSYMEMYNNHLSDLKDVQKSLICRQFIESIIVDWEEDSGHSIHIKYKLPVPKVQTLLSNDKLTCGHKESGICEESSFLKNKVLEKV